MGTQRIKRGDSAYPAVLLDRLGDDAPRCLYVMGNPLILHNQLLGLLCSIQCPGSIIIKTLDAVRALRDAGVVVISGFHSPIERECLNILLRGAQSIILCPAKGLKGLRIGRAARRAVREGRLLLISPFSETVRRAIKERALYRNRVVLALAKNVLVPYLAPGGKIWPIVHAALTRKQPVFTFSVKENCDLIAAGACPFSSFEHRI